MVNVAAQRLRELFVKHIENPFHEDMNGIIGQLTSITRLRLTAATQMAPIDQIHPLTCLTNLTQLQQMWVSATLEGLPAAALTPLTRLTSVSLSHASVHTWAALCDLPALQALNMGAYALLNGSESYVSNVNSMPQLVVPDALMMPKLTFLQLHCCHPLTGNLSVLGSLKALKELDCKFVYPLPGQSVAFSSALGSLCQLTRLSLDHVHGATGADQVDHVQLTCLSSLHELVDLRVSCCWLRDGISLPTAISRLQSLDLSWNHFASLPAVKGLTNLTKIIMDGQSGADFQIRQPLSEFWADLPELHLLSLQQASVALSCQHMWDLVSFGHFADLLPTTKASKPRIEEAAYLQ